MHGNLLAELVNIYTKSHVSAVAQRIGAGLSPRKPDFNLRSVLEGFLVEKVAVGEVFSQ
jgi:hypothetical protein